MLIHKRTMSEILGQIGDRSLEGILAEDIKHIEYGLEFNNSVYAKQWLLMYLYDIYYFMDKIPKDTLNDLYTLYVGYRSMILSNIGGEQDG